MDREKKNATGKKRERGQRRSWRFRVSIAVSVLLILAALGLVLLPFAVEWAGERYLTGAGALNAQITNVNLNLFTGRLSVVGLEVEGRNGDRVSFDRFEADAEVFSLLKKRVRLSNVSLVGLSADVRQLEDGTLSIGGLQAPAQTAQTANQEERKTVSWGFGFGIVDLYDLQIHLSVPELEETVTVNHFLLKDFATWIPESRTAFLLNGSALGAKFQVDGTVSPLAEVPTADIRYDVVEFPLDRLNTYLEKGSLAALAGVVNIRGNVGLSLPHGSRNLSMQTSLTSGQVSASLNLNPDSIQWKHENFSFQMKGSYSDSGTAAPEKARATVNLTLEGVHVIGPEKERDLLEFGFLEVKDLAVTGTRQVTVNQVSLNNIVLLSRPEETIREKEPSNVVRLGGLTVTGINLENRYLFHVTDVSLDSLEVWILRREGGKLEPMELVPVISRKTPGGVPEKQEGDGDTPETAMDISIDRISLSGKNSLTFRDLDVKPPMTFQVDSLEMEVSDLDTDPSRGHAYISLEAGMGKYSSFHADGNIKAPWSEPDVNMQTRLRTLDLPLLTPYTDRYLGYILKSGHLDTDLDLTITGGKLDAQTEVVFNRIEMNPVKEEDARRAEDRLGIPVRTALSLLKDKNDDIKLKLPIEGDLNDPEFNISDVVLTVTGNALKKGVSAFYGPLGATLLTGGLLPPGTFSVLGKVFQGVTTVKFDPVIFKPLESELSAEHKLFLDQLAAKLTEKPDTRLILCGKVTRRDIMAMRERDFTQLFTAGSPASAKTGLSAGDLTQEPVAAGAENQEMNTTLQVPPAGPPSLEEMPLTDGEKENLIEVAKQRALAVKDYLIETGGLDQERLFVCYSDVEIEKGGPSPRVDLSI